MKLRGLRRAVFDLYRHPIPHVLSVLTISVSLLIVGAYLVCYRGIERAAQTSDPTVNATLYLQEDLTAQQVSVLIEKIKASQWVEQAIYRDREEVVNELVDFLGIPSNQTLPGAELFPQVVEVELKSGLNSADVDLVKHRLTALSGVAEVDFAGSWFSNYRTLRSALKFGGAILMALLLVGCSFIVAGFMGMRQQSRKAEIEIVQLIGGAPSFVASPFLWEALIEATIGSAAAILVLKLGAVMGFAMLSSSWSKYLPLGDLQHFSISQILVLWSSGIAMAVLGSLTVFFRLRESRGA